MGGNILTQEKARNKRTENPERLRLAAITYKPYLQFVKCNIRMCIVTISVILMFKETFHVLCVSLFVVHLYKVRIPNPSNSLTPIINP
jgi:hypothetical protein